MSQWFVDDPDPVYGCVRWLGNVDSNGYGWLWLGKGKKAWAHRQAWERAKGRIPEGMDISHMCQRRTCVRLEHLELLSHRDNMRLVGRRSGFAKRMQRKACPSGHDLWQFGRRTPEAGLVCTRCCGLR